VKLKFYAGYRSITNCKETDVSAAPDIWTLLVYLSKCYGKGFRDEIFTKDGSEISDEVIILVNGRNISFLNGKNTTLTEADIVSIFPVVAGG
jgi:molybdopterin synthase sulfur carrier subunit